MVLLSPIKYNLFFLCQYGLWLMYPSGRYQEIKYDYVYSWDSFVADLGGYLVKC
jgi:hypothetical protein